MPKRTVGPQEYPSADGDRAANPLPDPERFVALCRSDTTGLGADMLEFVTHFAYHAEKILQEAGLL